MYTYFFSPLLTTPLLILFPLEKPLSSQDQVILPSGIFTPSNSRKNYYYCLLILLLLLVVVVLVVVLSSRNGSIK
jgi:hypothetical protein